MKALKKCSLIGLRWTVGIILAWQSYRLLRHTVPQLGEARHSPLTWIHLVLGSGEIMAAILFLIPRTRVIGGWALLVIIGLAAVISVLHGSRDVSVLLLYAMAVLVCMTHDGRGAA
jgi:hypothetical protein